MTRTQGLSTRSRPTGSHLSGLVLSHNAKPKACLTELRGQGETPGALRDQREIKLMLLTRFPKQSKGCILFLVRGSQYFSQWFVMCSKPSFHTHTDGAFPVCRGHTAEGAENSVVGEGHRGRASEQASAPGEAAGKGRNLCLTGRECSGFSPDCVPSLGGWNPSPLTSSQSNTIFFNFQFFQSV